jgi:hypothetical protein
MGNMNLVKFIKNSGLADITSRNIFLKPELVKAKIVKSIDYHNLDIVFNDVVAFIDDTFFLNGKRCLLLTSDRIYLNVGEMSKFSIFYLSLLDTISCDENEVKINGSVIAKFQYPGCNELRYFFSVLNDYVSSFDGIKRKEVSIMFDFDAIQKECFDFIYPRFFTEEDLRRKNVSTSFLQRKPVYTPGFYVGDRIPKDMVDMARFFFSIPEDEQVISFINLSSNGVQGVHCTFMTTSGIYSRDPRGEEIYISWSDLIEIECIKYFEYDRFIGVEFSNRFSLIVSIKNVIVKPFGLELIGKISNRLKEISDIGKGVKVKKIESIDFEIAFSFPGEKRDYVSKVHQLLENDMGDIFYDLKFQSQLAKPNLDDLLQNIYRYKSKLIVVFISEEYAQKDWCGLEWRAIKDIIKCREMDKVMLVKFDDAKIDGIFSTDGYIDGNKYSEEEVAQFIRERVSVL